MKWKSYWEFDITEAKHFLLVYRDVHRFILNWKSLEYRMRDDFKLRFLSHFLWRVNFLFEAVMKLAVGEITLYAFQ